MERVTASTFTICDAEITFLQFDLAAHALRARLWAALSECDELVGLENVARQTFFLSDKADAAELERVVKEVYGLPAPVTTCVHQPPAQGHAVSCELWAFASEATLHRGRHVTWSDTPAARWGFVGGMATADREPIGSGVRRMLSEAQNELHAAGMDFAQTVRTWYYIGDLLGARGDGTRYDRFNAARNAFYRDKWPNLCLSPASTGIGMNTDRIAFEALLLSPRDDGAEVAWVDNPLQTQPYHYELQKPRSGNPSFSRGAAFRHDGAALLFVSGTASIRGSRVIHVGDVAAQTEATIENIATLLAGGSLEDMQQLRVYIKRRDDLEIVRDCCRSHLPDVPCVYSIADVCRPECLVEIEGIHATPAPVCAADSPVMAAGGTRGLR